MAENLTHKQGLLTVARPCRNFTGFLTPSREANRIPAEHTTATAAPHTGPVVSSLLPQ